MERDQTPAALPSQEDTLQQAGFMETPGSRMLFI